MALEDPFTQALLDPNQEFKLTVGPPRASSGSAQATGGGAATRREGAGALAGQGFAPIDFGGNFYQNLTPTQRSLLNRNPQLVTNPNNIETDPIYEAEAAQLRANAQNQVIDILRDIGFVGDTGQFLPGRVATEAERQLYDLGFGKAMAEQGVNENAVRGGTFFSGRRAQRLGEAAHPFVRDAARLQTDVGNIFADRLEALDRILSSFGLDRNLLLAALSARLAERARQNPVGAAPAGPAGPPTPPGSEVPGEFRAFGPPPSDAARRIINRIPSVDPYKRPDIIPTGDSTFLITGPRRF